MELGTLPQALEAGTSSKMDECEGGAYCTYRSPFSTRYASQEMLHNFSEMKKFSTWRSLWYFLAKAQKVKDLNPPLGVI